MTELITRDEFDQLAARLGILEREVDGEKMVTRHVLSEARRTSDRVAALEARLDRMERKVDDIGRRLAELDGKLTVLTTTLPRIVADALRAALRERDGR
ncbi:hypothetical protein PQJ75_29825 [Rhodoplanes sp. TEM]|uniref:DUF4164 family protein n=1 Tax=Rhodoplanes tepidamans TaxID=200616 RepID=A0ABT5JJX1_RHOTP|nr:MULTISPECIES: hypothetical protein [Rhodoplanes]MDC7790014.1 hypothetical protein [Rhodoplanes tepidamans]MDC7987952.1 hypothetical protein [Rhodoplanes sp. TEM]MDQ0358940.1 uncharacterized protein YoxC [Rhodoplanes tepidamans]